MVFVLAARCRGPRGAGGLESARMAVVTSVTVGRKLCSQSGFRYLSLWQRSVRRWERRGPHVEWPRSLIFNGAAMGTYADAMLE